MIRVVVKTQAPVGGTVGTLILRQRGADRLEPVPSNGEAIACSPTRDDVEWEIDAVVYGDGSTENCGITLQRGVLYASASITGRHENFHAIDVSSLQIELTGKRPRSFATRPLSKGLKFPRACVVPLANANAVSDVTGNQTCDVLRRSVLSFARRNPGVVVILGGPGARDGNPLLEEYHIRLDNSILATSADLDCVTASVVNAIGRYDCESTALEVMRMFESDPTHYLKLGQLGNTIDRMKINFEIRKPNENLRRHKFRDRHDAAFKWLAEEGMGVWLVRLIQSKVVDHCVVLDCDGGIIIDSEEDYPLILKAESLKMCGGPKAKNLKVAELFQLCTAKMRKPK